MTVNILFTNHDRISRIFPIHHLLTGKFTDHVKPLPYPVREMSVLKPESTKKNIEWRATTKGVCLTEVSIL